MVHGGRGARLPDVPQIQCKIIIPRGRYTNASDRFRVKDFKKEKSPPARRAEELGRYDPSDILTLLLAQKH